MKTITVTYDGSDGINSELDEKIIKAMESIGAGWYGQGMSMMATKAKRDISFEIE